MEDFLYRGLIKDYNIRFAYALTTQVANRAVLSHGCDPVVAHLLSRSLNAGVLCSPTLTEDERATVTWAYPGPIGKVQVDFGANADVRGMSKAKTLMNIVNSEAEVYGDTGSVQIMKSSGHLVLSNGTCEGPIMDSVGDLCYFFSVSEQLETDMYISVGFNPDPEKPVDLCQGLMLQAMPDCDFEALDRLRKKLHSEGFRALLNTKPEADAQIKVLEELLSEEESNPVYEIYPCNKPEFKCRCSREKTQNILTTLSKHDVEDIVAKGEDVAVSCQFCSTVYSFTPQEVKETADPT